MKQLAYFVVNHKKVVISQVEKSDYEKQPHYRDTWEPAQSATGQTISEEYRFVLAVNDEFIIFI